MTKMVGVVATVLLGSSLFLGCQNNAPGELHASGKPYYEIEAMRTCLVEEQGMSKDDLVIRDTIILFQGDIMFPIENFRETYGSECLNNPISQACLENTMVEE